MEPLGQTLNRAWQMHERGEYAQAETLYRQILDVQPGHSVARFLLGVTFGSFNQFSKVTPAVLATWADVLRAVETSRLVLLAELTRWLERYVAESFERAGIDAGRVELAPRRPYHEYLQLIASVDVALDAFPFNGHTTVCDCLWQGVPPVMMAGKPMLRGSARRPW